MSKGPWEFIDETANAFPSQIAFSGLLIDTESIFFILEDPDRQAFQYRGIYQQELYPFYHQG